MGFLCLREKERLAWELEREEREAPMTGARAAKKTRQMDGYICYC